MFLFNSSCRPIREQISAEAPVSAQVLWSGSLKRWNWEWGLVHIVCFWSVWGSDGVSLEETEPPYQDTTHFLSWRKWGGSGEEGGGGGGGGRCGRRGVRPVSRATVDETPLQTGRDWKTRRRTWRRRRCWGRGQEEKRKRREESEAGGELRDCVEEEKWR